MSTQENKTLARQLYEDIFSQGKMALIDEIFDTDYVNHDTSGPPEGWPRGKQGFHAVAGSYRTAIPDITFTIEEQVAEADRVVTRWTARGTNTGSLAGLPPTGKTAVVRGMSIERIAGGKIAESWVNFDQFGMLQQLGIIPSQG